MTILIERMREELVRRNYAATTINSYLKAVEHFRSPVRKPWWRSPETPSASGRKSRLSGNQNKYR